MDAWYHRAHISWVPDADRKTQPRKKPAEPAVLTPSEFARLKLGFDPDDTQRRILDSQSKRGILNCTRQWGKSTVAAAKAVHLAFTEPGSLILVASPGRRQSGEFLRKAAAFLRRLGHKQQGDGTNPLSLRLDNGSRIVGLPGREATVRGFSAVRLLLIDEASRVPDELYQALRPSLATTRGSLWLMSTPRGRSGFFYEAWAHGGDRWERFSVPASECPRITAEFLAGEMSERGTTYVQQEYLCEFVDDGANWFDRDLVEQSLSDDEPWNL